MGSIVHFLISARAVSDSTSFQTPIYSPKPHFVGREMSLENPEIDRESGSPGLVARKHVIMTYIYVIIVISHGYLTYIDV